MNQPDLSFIIVNYRSADALRTCLESLEADSSNVAIEYIVVNNDPSEQAGLDRLAERFPIRIIHSEENVGFGAASNTGAGAAGAEILGFLNPDTRLSRGSLRDISDYFYTHPEAGIAGATLIDRNGRPELWSAGPSATLFRILRNNLCFFNGMPPINSGAMPVGFVSGAALFIRKPLFDELDGFDERFFLYFEDMDICLRARKRGARVVRLSEPVFAHEGGLSQCSDEEQKRQYYASQDIYFEKHRPKWEGQVMKLLRRWFVR
jgi:N-acetylglucosaminyl-diphospho-decaprenol L-rhamnosyltransferase